LGRDAWPAAGESRSDALAALVKELEIKGSLQCCVMLQILRQNFSLAFFKPAHGLNDEVLTLMSKIVCCYSPGSMSSGRITA